jgi:hypothetical protein
LADITKLTQQQKDWLVGFTEGDGSIGVYSDKWKNAYISIRYGQKYVGILQYIKILIGGNINKSSDQYILNKAYKYAVELLPIFRDRTVSNHFNERYNKALKIVGSKANKLNGNISIDWFVGFWDAEGYSSNKPEVLIEQKELYVLEIIKSKFGGNIYRTRTGVNEIYRWSLSGKNKTRELVEYLINNGQHKPKIERLRNNYYGLSYQQINKDRINYRNRQYNKRDKIIECKKKYYEENKEKIREYHRIWRQENKGRINNKRDNNADNN